MVVAAVASAVLVVGLASITSGGAVTSLARSSDVETVVQDDPSDDATPTGSDLFAGAGAGSGDAPASRKAVDPDASVTATGSELSAADVVTPTDVHDSRTDAQALADQVGEETGRTVVLVFQEPSSDGREVTWTHTDIPGRAPFVASDEAALVGQVKEWISAQKSPDAFELIVDE